MAEPPRPHNEETRLLALDGLGILDTPDERAFDAVTRIAADHYDCSVSLVTFVDRQRQWFKACHGWDVKETDRQLSFCAYAILEPGPLVVPDAREDERFRDNELVTGSPYIRFYAGVPLTTSDGFRLGTLCVIDDRPHLDIGPSDLGVLEDLAEIVVENLEMRLQNAQTYEERKRFEGLLAASQEGLVACDATGKITYLNDTATRLLGMQRARLLSGSMAEVEGRLLSDDGLPLDAQQAPTSHVLQRGTALPTSTFGLQRDDGSLAWIRVRAEPILDAEGRVAGAAMSLQPYRAVEGLGRLDPA